jgi:hypothetical protein
MMRSHNTEYGLNFTWDMSMLKGQNVDLKSEKCQNSRRWRKFEFFGLESHLAP